ncbi:kinase-like domain-containing protein [Mycena filopes]|nr:kinase-like domain-containing protein [Mycena filopes]
MGVVCVLRLFTRLWVADTANGSLPRTTMSFAFICQILTRLSVVSSVIDTARCRAVATAVRAVDTVVDSIFLVAAGAQKLATRLISANPKPTKTVPIFIPPTPTPFPSYTPPVVLWLVLLPLLVVAVVAAHAAYVKIARRSIGQSMLKSLGWCLRRIVNVVFVVLVSVPLLLAGEVRKVYRYKAVIAFHRRGRMQRDGKRRLELLLLPSNAAVVVILGAYRRLLVALVAGLVKALQLSGYSALTTSILKAALAIVNAVHSLAAPPAVAPAPDQPLPSPDCIEGDAPPYRGLRKLLEPFPGSNVCVALRKTHYAPIEFQGARSWKTMTRFSDKFLKPIIPAELEEIALLGSGTFGSVFKVRSVRTGAIYAVKKLKKDGTAEQRDSLVHEVEVQLRLRGLAAFAALHGVFHDAEAYYLVMECGERALIDVEPLSPRKAMALCRQIAKAVHAMHQRGVIHCDLKLENIVVDAAGGIKIIDFGVSEFFDLDETEPARYPEWDALRRQGGRSFPMLWRDGANPDHIRVRGGSPLYICPEAARWEVVSYGTDLWAVGVMFHWLLYREIPVFYDTQMWQGHGVSGVQWRFFRSIFCYDPVVRFADWKELLAHPFWKSV